nr:hypothetical protein [Methylobacterium sp. ZNC0032]
MRTHPRLRKAWRVAIEGYDDTDVVYAITGSEAKYALYVAMDSSRSFAEFLQVVTAHREPARDILLPDRHPLAAQLDPRILSCVTHAYGGTGFKAGYRDHYFTSDRDPMPKAAYYHGLFEMHRVPRRIAGDRESISYILTELGKNVARGEAETYPRW